MADARNTRLDNPGEIYNAVKNREKKFYTPIEISKPEDLKINLGVMSAANTQRYSDDIREKIKALREQDFDGYFTDADGLKVLVKYHSEDKNHNYKLNPIPIYEAEIQALRYFNAMLLIANNITDENIKNTLILKLNAIRLFYNSDRDSHRDAADLTLELSSKLAQCIATTFNIDSDSARKQLTMARDLGIMLEDHPGICTISEDGATVTIEQSKHYKVRKEYYDDNEIFDNLENQPWFINAKDLAGFDQSKDDTWMDNFFLGSGIKQLQDKQCTAPPSARWLPIPANNQIVTIDVAKDAKKEQFSHTEFMRSGVLIPYDVRPISGNRDSDEEQKRIAKKILRELIIGNIDRNIENYKQLYGEFIDPNNFNYYINYQSLLSPLITEERVPHIDNNAKFITLIKEVMKEMENDEKFKNYNGAKIQFFHTNSAVNRNAHLSNEDSKDDEVRREKIEEFKKLKKEIIAKVKERLPPNKDDYQINNFSENKKLLGTIGFTNELIDELIQREKACACLERLLNNEKPYKKLDRNQRNIMMAALEHLAMGSQAMTIAGCKSARDRTGIFACAVKVMQETPAAMEDWEFLEQGIVKSLMQGHAFRSMSYHSAIVKVSLVHKKFMHKLNIKTQEDIKTLLVFSKKTPKYKEKQGRYQTADTQDTPLPVISSKTLPIVIISQSDANALIAKLPTDKPDNNEFLNLYVKLNSYLFNAKNIRHIDDYLSELRNEHLNSKSFLLTNVSPNLQIVRVFPANTSNVNASTYDFFASGIDSTRGVLAIIQYSPLSKDLDATLNRIKEALKIFQEKITALNFHEVDNETTKLSKLEKAQAIYKEYNGVLANILVETGCYQDEKMAAKGILEARDLIWIENHKDESVCTIRNNSEGKPIALSFSKRLNFTTNDMTDYENQPWFEEFNGKHPWAKEFIQNNPDILKLSATPMQRSTPNPANAWEEATILIKDNKAKQIISGVRLGITSPYQIKDKTERQRLTNRNHRLMASDERLTAYVKKHMEMWDGLHEGEINIPILHQTLVDPGALRYISDRTGQNPADMIKRKRIANIELQKWLANKNIYYHGNTVLINPNPIPKNATKVNFIVKETNNGINVHEKMTKKVTRDISDSQDLVKMAVKKMELFKKQLLSQNDEIGNLMMEKILNYIKSSTLENPREMTQDEKNALSFICFNLHRGQYSQLNPMVQRNLALLIQAAVQLSSFLSNDIDKNFIGFVKDGAAMGNKKFKLKDLNDATYKSCYERIIAELLGVRMGGCKSALDREQEVSELVNAMYRQFHETSNIVGYHDTPDKKDEFRNIYLNTQHKHNMCEMITGNLGSCDNETQGKAYYMESKYEKKASSLLERGCRKSARTKKSFKEYRKEHSSTYEGIETSIFKSLMHGKASKTLFKAKKTKAIQTDIQSETVIQTLFKKRAGNKVEFYSDAYKNSEKNSGAFNDILRSIADAEKSVLLTGWTLSPTEEFSYVDKNGNKITTTLPKLFALKALGNTYISALIWNNIAPDFSSDTKNFNKILEEEIKKLAKKEAKGTTTAKQLEKRMRSNLNIKFSETHLGYSDHAKMVITDSEKLYMGGLDLTINRSNIDTWHDCHCRITGPSVEDAITLFSNRFKAQSSHKGKDAETEQKLIDIQAAVNNQPAANNKPLPNKGTMQLLTAVRKEYYDPNGSNVSKDFNWEKGTHTTEILQSQIQAIRAAENFIYMENQFFTGPNETVAGPNQVIVELLAKIKQKILAGEEFHFYCQLPFRPEGDHNDILVETILRKQWKTMQWFIESIKSEIEAYNKDNKDNPKSVHDYITFSNIGFHKEGKQTENGFEMKYTHSKLMIIDDNVAFIGSNNCNERSNKGNRDHEICMCMKGYDEIETYRKELMEQHFGKECMDKVANMQPGDNSFSSTVQSQLLNNLKKKDGNVKSTPWGNINPKYLELGNTPPHVTEHTHKAVAAVQTASQWAYKFPR